MSLLSRYLDWFRRQTPPMQIGSTILLFATLFVLGLYTLGLLPLGIIVIVLIDHWLRESRD